MASLTPLTVSSLATTGTLTVTGAASTGALTTMGVTNTGNESIAGTLAVTGASTLTGLATTSNGLNLPGSKIINFGSDQSKEGAAGRMGYQTYTAGCLDIVGAGTTSGSRTVKIYDNLLVSGAVVTPTIDATSLGGNQLYLAPASMSHIWCLGASSAGNSFLFNAQGVYPGPDATHNLGIGSQRWKNLYLSGTITSTPQCFHISASGSKSNNANAMTSPTIDFDTTGGINTSSGVFTAPLAGYFSFTFMARINDGATSTCVYFVRNGSGYVNMWAPNDSQSRKCTSGSVIMKLASGDNVTCYAGTDNSSSPSISGIDFCGSRLT